MASNHVYGSPYKGHERYAGYAEPYLLHNGLRCRKYMWVCMAADVDVLKIDGRFRRFDRNTKLELGARQSPATYVRKNK